MERFFKILWNWLVGLFRRKPESPKVPEPTRWGSEPLKTPEPAYATQVIRRGRLGSLGMQTSPGELVTRIPTVGDRVWWAPKQLWCVVDRINHETMNFVFIGGEPVRRTNGQLGPRWEVNTGMGGHYFDQSINAWIVGHGQLPKSVRGKIITPEPIKLRLNVSTGEVSKRG